MAAKKKTVNRATKRRAPERAPRKFTRQQKALAAAVKEAGSQGKLAKKLGCSQQSVSAWLKGEKPRLKMQQKMRRKLGIEGAWL